MWENIMALWKIRKGEFALYLSMTGIIWLFGNLFSGLMKKNTQFPETLPFATFLAVCGGVIMCVIGFGIEVFCGYDFFLRFCHTRKEFLLSSGVVTFLQSLIMTTVLKILLETEMMISHSLFAGTPTTSQFEKAVRILSGYVSVPWLPVYALLIAGFSCAGGAFVHRFRTRGAWILVLMCLLCAMGIPKIFHQSWFYELTERIMGAVMIGQLLLGIFIGFFLYLAGALGLRNAGVN